MARTRFDAVGRNGKEADMQTAFDRLFSTPKFGWTRAEDGTLVPNKIEQRVLDEIDACLKAGVPLRRIAEILIDSN